MARSWLESVSRPRATAESPGPDSPSDGCSGVEGGVTASSQAVGIVALILSSRDAG